MEEQFKRWKDTLEPPPAVKFVGEEDGVATISFGTVILSVTTIMDDDKATGFFVEVVSDDAPDEIESWITNSNDVLMDKPKFSFGDAIAELVKTAPKSLLEDGLDAPALGSAAEDEDEDEEHMFEDDDDDLMVVQEEDEATRNERRQKYAKKLADDQEEEKTEEELNRIAATSSSLSRQAQQVLMRDMRALLKLKGDGSKQALNIDMVGDRLDHWRATLHADSFPAGPLKQDLFSFAKTQNKEPAVIMDLLFPSDYPLNPPFIRVIRPRFQMHTGHVTIGGSVCMEALTPSGWLPTFSLENIFVEIRSQMVEGDGRLDMHGSARDYSEAEAREAFNRVASRYGWLKPKK